MRQGQPGRGADVLLGHRVAATPCGQGDRGPGGDQVGAHAIHAERAAHRADLAQRGVRQVDVREAVAGRGDLPGQGRGVFGEAGYETRGAGFEGEPAAYHLGPFGWILAGRNLHGQPEPVEQLRAQLAFFRVHGADQQEPRGVPDRDALALHVVHAQRGRVEQQVDEVVVEQVDFVHVEHPAMRRGQQAGLEGGRARGQHALDVQRAGQPVLGRPHRELGQRDRAELGRGAGVRSRGTRGVGRRGITRVRAAGDHRHRRQQRGQAADHGRLRGALLAPDQDPADGRRHRVEQERQLQVRHPDDAGERISAVFVPGRHRHRSQSFPGFLARRGGAQRQPESLAPGQDGDLAGHPRSQLRDSPGFAPAFLRVATSAQHRTPAGRGAGQYPLTRRVHWPRFAWGARCQSFGRKLSAGTGSVAARITIDRLANHTACEQAVHRAKGLARWHVPACDRYL